MSTSSGRILTKGIRLPTSSSPSWVLLPRGSSIQRLLFLFYIYLCISSSCRDAALFYQLWIRRHLLSPYCGRWVLSSSTPPLATRVLCPSSSVSLSLGLNDPSALSWSCQHYSRLGCVVSHDHIFFLVQLYVQFRDIMICWVPTYLLLDHPQSFRNCGFLCIYYWSVPGLSTPVSEVRPPGHFSALGTCCLTALGCTPGLG